MDNFTGGCLCGAVRYRATGEPYDSLICHCRMCQRASGAPVSALVFVNADQLKVTGELRTVALSPRSDRQICGTCFSPLFITRQSRLATRALYVGSLDDASWFRPKIHICLSGSMAWLGIHDDLPRYEEEPDGYTPPLHYDPVTGATWVGT
jgi:hypothetical protein